MRIVIDIDGTISELKKEGQTYADLRPNPGAVEKISALKQQGHHIILHTARHMKTCSGDVEMVKQKVGKTMVDWLNKHNIPYDEIHFGKPYAQMYIDDLSKTFTGWDSMNVADFDTSKMNVVIPMAGLGSRFSKAGYTDPKPLIDVLGQPMIAWAMKSFGFLRNSGLNIIYIFVILKKDDETYKLATKLRDLFGSEVKIVVIESSPGQAFSVFAAKKFIDNNNKLLIFNCDTYSTSNMLEVIQKDDPDGILDCFTSNDPRYSYAKLDQYGHVCETAEKKVISEHATTGMYYFKRGSDFIAATQKMLDRDEKHGGEFYVAPLYNDIVRQGKNVRISHAQENWILGTPEELDFFKKNYKK